MIFKLQNKGKKLATLVLFMVLILMGNRGFAQQDPLYSQYMFNIQMVNPAYVGTWETIGVTALTRNQWLGVDRAPQTNTLSVQSPTRGERVGIGASLMNDKFGHIKRLAFFTDYSYKVQLDDRGTQLRFGLKAGFSNYTNNLSAYDIQDSGDPAFQGMVEQKFMPNFGFGVFLHQDKYYFGASIPKMIEHSIDNDAAKNYSIQSDIRHWFFMGGYVVDLSEGFKFKPSVTARMVSGAPLSADFNANFLLNEKFWFGGMYRTGAGFGVNLQWIVDKKMRIGYAIDYSNSGIYKNSLGIHELMISYEFNFIKDVYASPRYF
ncbi:MAG: type IX secretion system membrane protein PorP/SprF [Mangrovibacterium sp.]